MLGHSLYVPLCVYVYMYIYIYIFVLLLLLLLQPIATHTTDTPGSCPGQGPAAPWDLVPRPAHGMGIDQCE